METTPLTNLWYLIHSVIQEFWAIIEPHIEEIAIEQNIPIELYSYSELGLDSFSKEEFQRRDPYSNSQVFDKVFVTLNFKGWIELLPDGKYQVTEKAREAARSLIQAGDQQLLPFESFTDMDLNRLVVFLKQIVLASTVTPEPPEKWAISKRFRVADKNSPGIVQVREYLMDLHAYRDDCHYAAAHPHFGRAGIIWIVLGSLWKNDSVTAEQLAESLVSRGYEINQYEVALQAAVQIGWARQAEISGKFCITQSGRKIREQAEQLTNKYFFAPWFVLTRPEIQEFHNLLLQLREQLNSFRKRKVTVTS